MSQKTEKDYWDHTKELLGHYKVTFGREWQEKFYNDPKRLSFHFSRAKFASKIACQGKTVLELGCEEGMGSTLLGELASSYLGIDSNLEAILSARNNHPFEKYRYECEDFLGKKYGSFEVVVSFDFNKHLKMGMNPLFATVLQNLAEDGVFFSGCRSLLTLSELASLELKSQDLSQLQDKLLQKHKEYFHQVFPFGMQDEIVHTAAHPTPGYLIFLCCHKRK